MIVDMYQWFICVFCFVFVHVCVHGVHVCLHEASSELCIKFRAHGGYNVISPGLQEFFSLRCCVINVCVCVRVRVRVRVCVCVCIIVAGKLNLHWKHSELIPIMWNVEIDCHVLPCLLTSLNDSVDTSRETVTLNDLTWHPLQHNPTILWVGGFVCVHVCECACMCNACVLACVFRSAYKVAVIVTWLCS